jgi:hypothetical protein
MNAQIISLVRGPATRGSAWAELIEHCECCARGCLVGDDPLPNTEALVSTNCKVGVLLLFAWLLTSPIGITRPDSQASGPERGGP